MTAPMTRPSPARRVLREDHEAFRETVRRFVEREIGPHHRAWEDAGIVPRDVWLKAGREGLLMPAAPEEFGGGGGDFGHSAVLIEELAKVNATGVGFPLHSDIVAPYLLSYAVEARKRDWLPRMARGELIGAIAMTEPGAGSDLKSVRLTARREGDHYVLNGSKTFITNGINSGLVIVVAKTQPEAGARGVSLICVEEGTPGFEKGRKLEKIGLPAQDTAELFFDNVRVPAENRLGEENEGFRLLMRELAQERLIIAVRAAAAIEEMLAQTVAYARERETFGKPVFEHQANRFRLAEAKAKAAMLRSFVDDCLGEHLDRALTAERAAMAKLVASEMQGELFDLFLQMHGGYGYMKDFLIGRAWIDARIMRIYGGSSEIMKEIIARTL